MQNPLIRGRFALTLLSAVAAGSAVLGAARPAAARAAEGGILICPSMHAKAMPEGFRVEAIPFTGPSGDGRRGSAGFVVQVNDLLERGGTRFSFTFHRDVTGYGFQVIHPFEKGHVLVSVHSGVTIHRGGSWGDVGWGDPATSDKVELAEGAAELLPPKTNVALEVVSELSRAGVYQLWIDDKLICRHAIKQAGPLVLDVPEDESVWGGSSWDRTPFDGKGFNPKLQPGHAGLILGPMDGSAPKQNFQQIELSAAAGERDARLSNAGPTGAGRQSRSLQELLQEVRALRRELKTLEARVEKIERAHNR